MTNLRICFLVSTLGAGGAERVASTLCNHWAQHGRTVTIITTFSSESKIHYQISSKVKIIELWRLLKSTSNQPYAYIKKLLLLRREITKTQPHIIISFLPNVNIATLIANIFTSTPCIIGERSDPSVRQSPLVWKLACRIFYRTADCITVQTDAVAGNIGQLYGGLRQVAVVPNPLPVEIEKSTYSVAQHTHGYRVLLSLGRLVKEKRVELIIEAFSTLANKFPEWHLHIHGDGPQRDSLQALIHTRLMDERIHLMGATSEPWPVMRAADAFVMASDYEGFPNALLEAMGLGLPCIATDCRSGPREISQDGHDALLVPVNDVGALESAMQRLMSDPKLRQELGEQARRSVCERYRLDTILNIWDDIFRSVGVKP